MADNNDIPQYPFMFDPSQFANKYSNYAGKALPWPSTYSGVPTDAHGNPIQSYVDAQSAHDAWNAANPAPTQAAPVSLNSTPQHGAGALLPGQWDGPDGLPQGTPYSYRTATDPSGMPSGQTSLGRGVVGQSWQPQQGMAQQKPQQAQQAAAPTNPIDMNAAYMAALQNPGHVQTPGATVPQAAPPSNQSNVLQQFLTNWQNKGSPTTGAGNYNNQGFFNALRGNV